MSLPIADGFGSSCRTGNLRFNLPVAVDPYNGTHLAATFGPACPQQSVTVPIVQGLVQDAVDLLVNGIYQVVTPSSEDCKFSLTQRERSRFHSQALTALNPKVFLLMSSSPREPNLARSCRSRS